MMTPSVVDTLIKYDFLTTDMQKGMESKIRGLLDGRVLVGWATEQESRNDDLWMSWSPFSVYDLKQYLDGEPGVLFVIQGEHIPVGAILAYRSIPYSDSILIEKSKLSQSPYQEKVNSNTVDEVGRKINRILNDNE